jgi:hypothetical protein
MMMSRSRAFVFHLSISAIVGLALFFAFWFIWYPYPLAIAVGGHEIFMMLLGVDVVVGPLLTLFVFKSGKRTLKFDLAVIAVLQLSALAYGVGTLLAGRPVYIAALGHRFDLIQASDFTAEALATQNVSLPWLGPVWTGTRAPESAKERESLMFGGDDLGNLPQYYAPMSSMRDELLKRAQAISKLKELNPGNSEEIDRWLAEHGRNEDSVRFQGLRARNLDMTVMLDAKDASIIGIAPFIPWR